MLANRHRPGVVQLRVTPKTRNPFTTKALSIFGVTWKWHFLNHALAPDPELLIADEPTSALDATVQAEILRLLGDLVSRRGMGLLLISHDLPLVGHFCDRVAVMYAGRVVEELRAGELAHARHPYTRGLLDCMPRLSHPAARLPVMVRDPAWLGPPMKIARDHH